ncbi:MAG: hypothetical protein SFY67_04645 [Candidatus Melainabacteria bacterium]|nr:hypothetical protein [Candidatus Melainabacteria bacterium]
MAIQLNSRDELIFKLIEEHEVLLEKHISYFIADDAKPVLIRDRLRKLFYLDYLICHRHNTKLPWWTTPTKPLVYMLTKTNSEASDRFDPDWQRHHLEVANLRMLYLQAQHDGEISNFNWLTLKDELLNAKVTFECKGETHKIGIINNFKPTQEQDFANRLEKLKQEMELTMILVISRDDHSQKQTQKMFAQNDLKNSIFFCLHQEMYQSGAVSKVWQNAANEMQDVFGASNWVKPPAGHPHPQAFPAA